MACTGRMSISSFEFPNILGRITPPPGLGNLDLLNNGFAGLGIGVFRNNNSISSSCLHKFNELGDTKIITNIADHTPFSGNCNISLDNLKKSFDPIDDETIIRPIFRDNIDQKRCITPPPRTRSNPNTPPRIKNSPGNRKKDTTHIQQSIKRYTSKLNDNDLVSFNDIKMVSFHNMEDESIDNIINHANQMNNQSKDFLCDKLSKFILINQHKIHSEFNLGQDVFNPDDDDVMNISFFRKIECKNCVNCIECKQNVQNNISNLMDVFKSKFDGNHEDLIDYFSSWVKDNEEKKMYCQKYCVFKNISISENMSCETIAKKLDENGLIKRIKVEYQQKMDTKNSHPLGKIIFPNSPPGKTIYYIESLRIQAT